MFPFRSDFTSTSATPGSPAPFGAPAASTAPAASGFADVLQTASRQERGGDVDHTSAGPGSPAGASDRPDSPSGAANSAAATADAGEGTETASKAAAEAAPGSPNSHSTSARHRGGRGKVAAAGSNGAGVGDASGAGRQSIAAIGNVPGGRSASSTAGKSDRQGKAEKNDKNDSTGAAPAPSAVVTDFTQTPKGPTANWSVPVSTPANDAATSAGAASTESIGSIADATTTQSNAAGTNINGANASTRSTSAAATSPGAANSSSPTGKGAAPTPFDTIDTSDPALEPATTTLAAQPQSSGEANRADDAVSATNSPDRSAAGRPLWATHAAGQPDLRKAGVLASLAEIGAGLDANAGDPPAAIADSLTALLADPTGQAQSDDAGQPLANVLRAIEAAGQNATPASKAAIARALAAATNDSTSSTSISSVTAVLKSGAPGMSSSLDADVLRAAADRGVTTLPRGIVTVPMPDLFSPAVARAFAPQALDASAALLPEGETASAVSQIVQSMRVQALAGGGEAQISLQPGYLGGVTVTVRVDQDTVTASVSADTPAVREALRSQESTLRQTLSDQGLRLDRFEVTEPSQTPRRHSNGGDRSPADEQPRSRSQKRRDPSAPAFEFVA